MTSFLSDLNASATNTSLSKDPLSMWRQLTLNVKGNPKNLKLHTQRIMLAMDMQVQPFLAGALQDLFLTVQATGRQLREKMLHLVSPLLESKDRIYFKAWFDADSDTGLECVCYPGSVLISTNCQGSSLTDDSEEKEVKILDEFLNGHYDNPVDKARYCVAYGNIDYAQKPALTKSGYVGIKVYVHKGEKATE